VGFPRQEVVLRVFPTTIWEVKELLMELSVAVAVAVLRASQLVGNIAHEPGEGLRVGMSVPDGWLSRLGVYAGRRGWMSVVEEDGCRWSKRMDVGGRRGWMSVVEEDGCRCKDG
jgi:hypothetical protein